MTFMTKQKIEKLEYELEFLRDHLPKWAYLCTEWSRMLFRKIEIMKELRELKDGNTRKK